MRKDGLRVGLVGLGMVTMFLIFQNLQVVAIAGDVPDNLALHGTASVLSVHEGAPAKDAGKLNDGLYGAANSWLGGLSDYTDPAINKHYPHVDSWWTQIDLGKVEEISAVAFGGESNGGAGFIIAAAGSLSQDKARADYVCDGIDDDVEIQAAINALPDTEPKNHEGTGGGRVLLSAGTFNIGATIKFHDKTVHLTGSGKDSTILNLQKGVNDDMLLVGTGQYQAIPPGSIAHMNLNGNSRFQSKGSGIRVKSGDMMAIESVGIYDFKENGIFLEGASPNVRPCLGRIENSRIGGNKKDGIYAGPGQEGWIIRGNWINDNGTIGERFHGIHLRAIHGKVEGPAGGTGSHIISNNVLWQNKWNQIYVDGGGHGGADIIISNNVILSSPYENIKISNGSHLILITGNTLHSASEAGIGKAPHITIEDSSFCVISNNAISSPSSGVLSQAVETEKRGEVEPMSVSGILVEKGGS
ncbi:MAG: right-handed parallel beta-helix repeat-containing protein, partial [Candidatus Margulisiibacteriota bacterium]